ncbi:hypothetical protein F5883DRAFT_594197 [Diaporthe sp. PMI_573]|nr:hypothetical protein F5883DRAFT_594197 [Diaporthaceae sp. PMI_573]
MALRLIPRVRFSWFLALPSRRVAVRYGFIPSMAARALLLLILLARSVSSAKVKPCSSYGWVHAVVVRDIIVVR